ncbi:MAG TPA: sensor domain-containing protein [Nocardioides sp.]|nr:sensor domain-containing protein [Nocardioides sp.]
MDETMQIPTTHGPHTAAVEPTRPNLLQRLLRDSAYSLTALPIGILTFAIVVTGLSAGAGLVIVWVGLPVLVGTVLVARAFAQLERLRLRSLQDRDAPPPAYLKAEADASGLRRLLTPLRDAQSWLDAFWGIVGFVTGLIAFLVTVIWWAAAAGGLSYWFWERWVPEGDDNTTLAELIGFGEGREPEIWLNLVLGAIALITLPWIVRAVAALHGGTASAMLDGRAVLRERAAQGATP